MSTHNTIEGRCFVNDFANQSITDQALCEQIDDLLIKAMDNVYLSDQVDTLFNHHSIYKGLGGILYLHLYMYTYSYEKKYLVRAVSITDKVLRFDSIRAPKSIDRMIGYLSGDAGVLSLCAIVLRLSSDEQRFLEVVNTLLTIQKWSLRDVNSNSDPVSNELLVGRIGLVLSLLKVNAYFQEDVFSVDKVILPVAMKIIEDGRRLGKERGHLIWEWHGKEYIGAVHGVAGILYILLQIPQIISNKKIFSEIQATCDWLVGLQSEENGNFPSRENGSTYLVQFCHGAPGVVPLLLKMYEITKSRKYEKSAEKACQAIWKYGVLRKDPCLCHGTAGNLFPFLHMMKVFRDDTSRYKDYKEKAKYFLLKALEDGCEQYNLFEGRAGIILTVFAVKQALLGSTKLTIPGIDTFHVTKSFPN